MTVSLREITADTLTAILQLKVADQQKGLVADNAKSIAQSHFEPLSWFRGVYADDEAVGFVLLLAPKDEPIWYVWRLMIDADAQGKGYGRAAMELVIDGARKSARERVVLSHQELPGHAGPFYAALGFEPTGEVDDGEVVVELKLSRLK